LKVDRCIVAASGKTAIIPSNGLPGLSIVYAHKGALTILILSRDSNGTTLGAVAAVVGM
jgi:hypothetical protein